MPEGLARHELMLGVERGHRPRPPGLAWAPASIETERTAASFKRPGDTSVANQRPSRTTARHRGAYCGSHENGASGCSCHASTRLSLAVAGRSEGKRLRTRERVDAEASLARADDVERSSELDRLDLVTSKPFGSGTRVAVGVQALADAIAAWVRALGNPEVKLVPSA